MSRGSVAWDPTKSADTDRGYGDVIGAKQQNGGVIPFTQIVDGNGNVISSFSNSGGGIGTSATPNVSTIKSGSTSDVADVTTGKALKVDASATTQPITAASLPLPANAAQDATVAATNTALASTNAALGTPGTTPPTLPGSATGVIGFLRYIGSLLSGTLNVTNYGKFASAGDTVLKMDAAGQTYVAGKTNTVVVNLTVQAATYAAGNVIQGVIAFPNAWLAANSGFIQSIRITSKTVQMAGFKFYPFSANPTNSTFADKTTGGIGAADVPLVADNIPLSNADSNLGTMTIWTNDSVGKLMKSSSSTLYGVLVITGSATFGSTSDLTIAIDFLQD